MPDTEDLSWQDRALCREVDPELFFPEKGASTKDAKAVCFACAARLSCLEYALARNERFGIYGGVSERARRKILAKRAGTDTPTFPHVPGLTDRQAEILHLRREGLNNVEISGQLGIHTKTVEQHFAKIREAGIIPPAPPSPTQDRPDTVWDDCGSVKALSRHKRQQVPACQACLEGNRERSVAYRASRKAAAA
jgi:WhiB family redox-sensing transcriptional regulator